MGICYMVQETQTEAVYQPREVGWEGRWESESEVAQLRLTFCDPGTIVHQAPPSMGFSRQEYWSGLPFPSPGNLPNPGIELLSPMFFYH